ncbi:MAG: ABC transporter ATP-binding protein [Gemmatimonadota bacterium]|jgi:ATP-binding cassette subfamily B protein
MKELKTVLPYVRPYRKAMALGLLMVLISNVFTIAGPYLMKLALDGLGDPDITSRRIASYAGMIVLAALLGGAAKYGMREIMNGTSRRIECDLRQDFFRHLLRLDAAFFGKTRTGDLMSRATNDTLAVRMATGPGVMYSVNTLVSFLFSLALMIWISPTLTLVALIPMFILPPIVIGFGKVIHRRFEEIQEQLASLSTMVQENLTGLRIVRAYVQEEEQTEQFDGLNNDYMDRNMALVKASGFFFPLLMLVAGVAMVVVLWYGGLQVMDGRITIGDFVAFTFYLALLTWPMIALGWVVNLFQRGAASMGRLNRILETLPSVGPPQASALLSGVKGGIEFRNVRFRYPGTDRDVLHEVSFRAEPGETVAVVGPTGAGKSTLVSLIPRIYDPTEGQILLDGTPLDRVDARDLRRFIGMVPQDTFLFSDTIQANIALGLEEVVEAKVRNSAEIAQIHRSILGFPEGYSTLLGERGINLSGGQKQRTALARALARDPHVLILDDALSAVDTHTEAKILQDLRSVLSGRTSFVISHRVSAVMNADQILVLDEGRVVERGTHETLLARGGTYATLLRRQLLEEELEEEEAAAS